MQLNRLYRDILVVATCLVMFTTATAMAQSVTDTDLPVLVKFKGRPGAAERKAIQDAGGKVGMDLSSVNALAARVPSGKLAALAKQGLVDIIETDGLFHADDAELDATWGVKQIGAGIVHAAGTTGAGVKVCLLDTGIDTNHPDLYLNYKGGKDFVNGDNDPADDNGHGSHTAGTIAAMMNSLGVRGTAPRVDLYVYKVLDANGNGNFSAVISALQECTAVGGRVTSNSYGSTTDPGLAVKQAFDNAYNAGITHVASAGNSGIGTNTVGWPAQYSSVIAVAATDSLNLWATFSSTGPAVSLSAPGVGIYSTYLNDGYTYMSGTSMAAPHVAGVAALVIACGVTGPSNVRQRMQTTAQDLGPPGRDDKFGYGLVRADLAITNCTGAAPVTDLGVSSVTAPASVVTNVLIKVNAVVTNLGNQPTSATTISLRDDGVYVVTNDVPALPPGQAVTVPLNWSSPILGSHTLLATLNTTDSVNTNNSGSTVALVTSSTPVPPAPVTDLGVTSLTAPASVVANASTAVSAVVTNLGNQNTNATTLTLRDNGALVATNNVPALTPGHAATVPFTWSSGVVGSHTLQATLNTADAVNTNNSASTVTQVTSSTPPPTPLLDLETTSVTAPASVLPNVLTTVSAVVTNVSNQTSSPTTILLRDNEVYVVTNNVPALNPGQSATVPLNWSSDVIGSHTLRATLNIADGVAGNNSASTLTQVTSTTPPPPAPLTDLGVTSLTAPASVVVNTPTAVSAVVTNLGNQNTNATTLTLRDNGALVATNNVPALTPGHAATVPFTWSSGVVGSHTLQATLNTADAVNTNNSASTVTQVTSSTPPPTPLLDLEATSVAAPASVLVNALITISAVVTNIGNQPTSATTISLRDNEVYVVTNDVPALNPGQSATVPLNWSSGVVGSHTLRATLNIADGVAGNNSASTVTQVTSTPTPPAAPLVDLEVTSVSAPASVPTNTLTTVNARVTNIGNQTTSATTILLRDNNVYVVTNNVPALNPGQFATVPLNWSSSAVGSHALSATLNFVDAVNSNNAASTVTQVTGP
ncbi:MAG: S8 family serine peptidase [Acidobacteriota bacterium]